MATVSKFSAGEKPTRVRYTIIFVLFVVTVIGYADRATFSIAGAAASKDLGLSPITMGWILSAFAWAYVIAQIPGGALLDRFGSKKIYVYALILWSFFTFIQAFAGLFVGATAAVALFCMRFMVGVAEAPAFPANARIVAAWFPSSERGTASAIFNASQYFALVVFAPLMGWLVQTFGWESVFLVMGVIGLIAAAIFALFIHSPVDHVKINKAEFNYIEQGGGLVNIEAKTADRGTAFTWHNVKQILTNRMLLGVYLGQYCINALTYFFSTWFPIYLVQERGMSIMNAGFTAVAPALCGFAGGLLGGVVSDRILKRTGSVTRARKTPLLFGMLLATIIIACNYVDQQWLIILFMSLAFFGKGVASLGWAVVSDTSPKELAGVTGSIFNTFGNAAGIVTPIVVGYLVAGTGSFDAALVYIGAHCVVTILAYFLIVGKIERLHLKPAP
jgi:ACS family glucarate transporter-like MFS transporter